MNLCLSINLALKYSHMRGITRNIRSYLDSYFFFYVRPKPTYWYDFSFRVFLWSTIRYRLGTVCDLIPVDRKTSFTVGVDYVEKVGQERDSRGQVAILILSRCCLDILPDSGRFSSVWSAQFFDFMISFFGQRCTKMLPDDISDLARKPSRGRLHLVLFDASLPSLHFYVYQVLITIYLPNHAHRWSSDPRQHIL